MERRLPCLALGGLLSASVLAGLLTPEVMIANPERSDVLTQVLGGASALAADSAFEQADVYFHAGVRERAGNPRLSVRESDALPFMGLIHKLQDTTVPKRVRHLEGKDERELLPWFHAAVRLNPHHIEAWCVGTYWYYRVGEYGQAEAFINDGIRHNPTEYKLYLERGVLFARLKQYKRALVDLEKAKTLRPQKSSDFEWSAVDAYLGYVKAKLSGKPGLPDLWAEEVHVCPRHH